MSVEHAGDHAEEFQLLGQPLGPLAVVQRQVDRLAQRRHEDLVQRVAVAQAGAPEAVHDLVEREDAVAGQAPAVVADIGQAAVDLSGEQAVLGLFEAFRGSAQTGVGIGQRGHPGGVPFAALQPLPDFQHLARVVDHALGEVLLEIFLFRHRVFLTPRNGACWLNASTMHRPRRHTRSARECRRGYRHPGL